MRKAIATMLTSLLVAGTALAGDVATSRDKTAKGAVIGGVLGTAVGAVIGNNRGHHSAKRGAVVGAVAGTAAGAIVGAMIDKQERELRQIRHPAIDGEDPDVDAARVHGGDPGTVQDPGLPGGAPCSRQATHDPTGMLRNRKRLQSMADTSCSRISVARLSLPSDVPSPEGRPVMAEVAQVATPKSPNSTPVRPQSQPPL